MKHKLTRAITVLTASVAVALAGVGTATAVAAEEPGGSHGSGTAATVRTTAAEVQGLHDALQAQADKGDVAAVKSTLAKVDTTLTSIISGERMAFSASSVRLADTAKQETADATKAIAELPQQSARDLPPVAGLLNALLQRLLLSLSSLVNDLLGGLVPAP